MCPGQLNAVKISRNHAVRHAKQANWHMMAAQTTVLCVHKLAYDDCANNSTMRAQTGV